MKKRWLSLVILLICAVGMAVTAELYPDSRETAPAVLYDGELYVCPEYGRESRTASLPEEAEYVGEIHKLVPADQLPKKNLCSNVKDTLGNEVHLLEIADDEETSRWLYVGRNEEYHCYSPYSTYENSFSGLPRIRYRNAAYRQISPACFTLGEVKQIRALEPVMFQSRRYLPFASKYGLDHDGDLNRKFLMNLKFYADPGDSSLLFGAAGEDLKSPCILFILDQNIYDSRIRTIGDYLVDLQLQWDGKLYMLTGSLTDSSIARHQRQGWPVPDTYLGKVLGSVAIDELPEEDGRTNCRSLTGCKVYGYSGDPAHIDVWVRWDDPYDGPKYLEFHVGMFQPKTISESLRYK